MLENIILALIFGALWTGIILQIAKEDREKRDGNWHIDGDKMARFRFGSWEYRSQSPKEAIEAEKDEFDRRAR